MNKAKLPRLSLVDSAVAELRSAVARGEWPVGERIPTEPRLSEQFGVGRNTVREAVRVLVHAGLLETRQGDGTYVRARLDPTEALRRVERSTLRDQLEMRVALEAEAARLAAQRRDGADLDAMHSALAARGAAGQNLPLRIQHDRDFHQAMIAAAHNRALTELYRYFSEAVARTIARTEYDDSLPEPSQQDHETLLAAMERGDADAAERQVRAMLAPALAALQAS